MVASKNLTKEEMSGLVAAEVEQLLVRLDPDLKRPAIISAAKLAGVAAASFAFLSLKRQAALTGTLAEASFKLEDYIQELAGIAREDLLDARRMGSHDSKPDGRQTDIIPEPLSGVTVDDWVGPSAGPTFLEKNFGIPRSTLHRWQRRNEVIALVAGGRRHVFPLAQFVDGRPAKGIDTVSATIGHPRLTWYWLSRPCEQLAGHLPIDLLKLDRVDEVMKAAHVYARTANIPGLESA